MVVSLFVANAIIIDASIMIGMQRNAFSMMIKITMATVKKIILLALTVLMMVGCKEENLKETVRHATESLKNEPILRTGMVVDIDSCQYIVCDAYSGWAFVHHNNCRFCKERRQKEFEELVIKLKEK